MKLQMSDAQLLQRYVAEGSEEAFSQLVERYLDLVFAAALRQLGDAEAAKDATQDVFIRLARKSRTLAPDSYLPGWLYRAAFFSASSIRRADRRRRELQSAMSCESHSPSTEAAFEEVAPELDAAMNGLKEPDRRALLLRFFEHRSLREVAAHLNVTEEAARKRIDRAVDQLRHRLSRRGITSSATALASVLQGIPTVPAPAGVGAVIAGAALAQASTGIGWSGAVLFHIMNTTKLKVAAGGLLLATAIVTPVWIQHQSDEKFQTQAALVESQSARLSDLETELKASQEALRFADEELRRHQKERAELARLREEVADLASQLAQTAERTQPSPPAEPADNPAQSNEPVREFSALVRTEVAAGETLVAGGWQLSPDSRGYVLVSPSVVRSSDGTENVFIQSRFVRIPENLLNGLGWDSMRVDGESSDVGWLVNPDDAQRLNELTRTEGVEVLSAPRITTVNGQQAQIAALQRISIDGVEYSIGPLLNVTPEIMPDGSSVRLLMDAKLSQPVDPSSAIPAVGDPFLPPPAAP